MCGIVGACSQQGDVLDTLLAGLRSLEYRGYDSAGVCVQAPGLPLRKAQGRVQDLADLIEAEPLPESHAGIAHTRWATHGVPSQPNAHPHRMGRLVLVHNGILENFDQFKLDYEGLGTNFLSDTDTEVWAALIWHELGEHQDAPSQQQMLAAIAGAMAKAKGSFALAVIHEALPELVFFARRESPLVLGITGDGHFLASDVAALLARTREFVYLEDDQLGLISDREFRVFDRELNPVQLEIDHIDWDAEAAEKGGYEHFMLKEIEEQGVVLAQTLQGTTNERDRVLPEFEIDDERIRGFDRLVILACGTALHAGRLGKYVIEEASGLPVDVDYASEFRYRDPMLGPKDLVLAISQSGETSDTLGALKVAMERGATPIAICNVKGSSLTRLAEASILTHCGPEIGVASTKAFTAQLLALHLLSLRLGIARRVMDEQELRGRLQVLRSLRSPMESLIGGGAREEIARIAKKYANKPVYFFLGRGADYPIALEGALKLKEISYVHAEGYPAGEMKHGPLALVSDDMVCVALAGQTGAYEKMLGSIQEVRARGGHVVVVTNPGRKEAIELADDVILVPETDPFVAPMLHILPMQYFAYYVAHAKGCDIDKPRNLAKSVTVE
ncbi:MAG: glutamine--fructose-6-phosphate transaminase (isomerizing) [Planctomycetota bacterium]|nr:MAG: glutamine--fructose-6-phosphate transaminase (isomerizing) [Planctomycetota bacterium]